MGRIHHRVCPHAGRPRFERQPVLSSSYRNRLARITPPWVEPEPWPDFQCAGPLTPVINGVYYEAGIHNGKPYYRRRGASPWYVWHLEEPLWYFRWYITASVGDKSTIRWHWRSTEGYKPPPGTFAPYGGAIGDAVLTEY